MADSKGFSFVRKGKFKGPQIPGTKVSIQNSQLLVSSGIPSFNSVIGGGLPVGAVILLDEDVNGGFAKLFMKYFLAEGVSSEQSLHVCSKDVDTSLLVEQLPGLVEVEATEGDIEDEKMKIAWRYQNMKLVSTIGADQQHFGHHFDLTRTLDRNLLKSSNISHWKPKEDFVPETFEKSEFGSLLCSIKSQLEDGKYLLTDSVTERRILRLGLFQIGSPLWPKTEEYLPIFLYCLRALVRNSFSTCMISVPFYLYEKTLRSKCIHLSDICIQLESFAGTPLEKNAALRDYNGFFRVAKWAAMNGLVTGGSQTVDLALKLRRRKLVVEKLHLPPDLDDSGEKELDRSSGFGCGSSNLRLLEF